jgi:RNA methyltransferase, TrmH family
MPCRSPSDARLHGTACVATVTDTPGVNVKSPGPLTSTHNPHFRTALALREARERRVQGRILIDGLREIDRALRAGVSMVEVWADERAPFDPDIRDLVERLAAAGASVVNASPPLLARLAYGDRNEGVVAVAVTPVTALEELGLPAEPLIGVIEGVEKPGNLGAILRTADGAGLSALVVADPGTDLFNPNVIRASLGTVFSVPTAVASTGDVLDWLRRRSVPIVAARVEGPVEYTEVDLTGPLAIALGSEARGLSDAWAELAMASVRIPMLGVADSLNVSATAAILFYEALRSRREIRRRPART